MKVVMANTVKTTNTLKGIAITSVLINHYLNNYVQGDSSGFANLWISVFFILSGYGLFHSFSQHKIESFTKKNLKTFYINRFLRIFPLLWSAWAIELAVRGGELSLWIPTGIHAQGHYWFIPSLLQCYMIAPFIYIGIIRKNPIFIISLIVSIFILINIFCLKNLLPQPTINLFKFTHSKWRKFYFLHILIFSFGLIIPLYIPKLHINNKGVKTFSTIAFWFFILLIILLMTVLKIYENKNYILNISFQIAPLLPIYLLCIFSLALSVTNTFFEFLGKNSYSIYLFHVSFYLLLRKFNIFPLNSIYNITFFAFLFSLFIFICFKLQMLGCNISVKLKSIFLTP